MSKLPKYKLGEWNQMMGQKNALKKKQKILKFLIKNDVKKSKVENGIT